MSFIYVNKKMAPRVYEGTSPASPHPTGKSIDNFSLAAHNKK